MLNYSQNVSRETFCEKHSRKEIERVL